MKSKAKKYNAIKLYLGIAKTILTFIILYFFVATNLSREVVNWTQGIVESKYLVFLLFTIITGVAISVMFAPLNFYLDFYLEHKYDLSNQSFLGYIKENLKELAVGSIIGLPLILLFFYFFNEFGRMWWLWFGIIMFIISVVLAQILPVVILPLFYKITPIENESLIERIKKLSKDVNLKIENVFKFDMSKNTKKANAAFTGLGKTKRIILGDTLLENFSDDEIESVIAHEIGHFKYKHITKNLIYGTLNSFLIFYLIDLLYVNSFSYFGFEQYNEIAALPLLTLWSMFIGLIQAPVGNFLSRKYEYQADEYAVKTTNKPEIFAEALDKLNDQNLGDEEPHPLVEWYFYSHPSIKKRKDYIYSLSK